MMLVERESTVDRQDTDQTADDGTNKRADKGTEPHPELETYAVVDPIPMTLTDLLDEMSEDEKSD